ncbi:MAG: DUF3027 domain-containing protein [Micrococcales bacterium]|nr:DUF3027 domain-containing protein [Micrococcales bacterium]MCL2666105.1 DUF3027 domain-containing protein [Micrococcales bacterium]
MTKDAVLDRAVDLARAAAQEIAEDPADVGEHLGATLEAERLVTHRFECTTRGYQGWHWAVAVARVPRGRAVSVCEAVLLPGDGALLARPWVPWSERLRPGDLGVGDVLPFRHDDPRLEPGWRPSGDPDADDAALVPVEELALARERVLAPLGRNETAARWYRGTHGPTSAGALAATAACATCGFLVPIRGALGQVFGVCANEWSPDDGTVVSTDHGCGAHSQTDADPEPSHWPAPDPLIDDGRIEALTLDRRQDADGSDAPTAEATDDAENPRATAPAEPVGVVEAGPSHEAAAGQPSATAGEPVEMVEAGPADGADEVPAQRPGATAVTEPIAVVDLAEASASDEPAPCDAVEPADEPTSEVPTDATDDATEVPAEPDEPAGRASGEVEASPEPGPSEG